MGQLRIPVLYDVLFIPVTEFPLSILVPTTTFHKLAYRLRATFAWRNSNYVLRTLVRIIQLSIHSFIHQLYVDK